MCRQNSPVHHAGEEEIAADESLLIYCKPVELYNILYRRALQNPSFLRRCLRYKIRASRKRRLRAGIVIFNYRDRYNILRKTEVTEDFSCPFCLMQCGNFKVTEDYQAVNVSVKIDILRSEGLAWGRAQRCFALAAHVDSKVVLYGDNGHCSPVKKSKKGPTRGPVRRCFELTAHVDDAAVFGYGQQWSKVSSDKKALRSMPNKGRAAALFTVKRGCAEKENRRTVKSTWNDPKLYGSVVGAPDGGLTGRKGCRRYNSSGGGYRKCHRKTENRLLERDDKKSAVGLLSLVSAVENVADGVIPQSQTFFFCSRPRKRRRKDSVQIEKRTNVKFLELDSPEGIHNGFLQKDDGRNHILSCKGENVSRTSRSEKIFPSGRNDGGKFGPDHPGTMDNLEHVESSFNIPGVSIAMPQSSVDPECSKSICKSDPALPAKTKKLSMDRSDSRNRMLLQKRLFFHSHRVQDSMVKSHDLTQKKYTTHLSSLVTSVGDIIESIAALHAEPMALEQVLSDRDSEDEVDDDIADLEDRRMLDDFVDVSKDEKQLMHLWNSFMRKQRVLADGHVPWACEAFSKLHGKELISSPALFWCWRLFMIKLWNHGLLDACTMNNCSIVLDSYRNEGSGTRKN
ncbi:Polycomb group protein EMF2B [Glycine soja]